MKKIKHMNVSLQLVKQAGVVFDNKSIIKGLKNANPKVIEFAYDNIFFFKNSIDAIENYFKYEIKNKKANEIDIEQSVQFILDYSKQNKNNLIGFDTQKKLSGVALIPKNIN